MEDVLEALEGHEGSKGRLEVMGVEIRDNDIYADGTVSVQSSSGASRHYEKILKGVQ